MKCYHCSEEIISLDDAPQHVCFAEKEIFIDNENNLFTQTENKQPAIWDRNGTLALLSLYEAKIDMLDHPKKKGKIWESISNDLQQNFGIQMSRDQVRWKINALIKKYKECIDNNSRSGRGLMIFEWFDQLDDILGQQRNAAAKHTMSSKFIHLKPSTSSTTLLAKPSTSSTTLLAKPSTSSTLSSAKPSTLLTTSSTKPSTSSKFDFDSSISLISDNCDVLSENHSNSQIISESNSTLSSKSNRKRPLHGSGSNLARTKVMLENQWLTFLKVKSERDKINDRKYADTLEQKKEMIKLKKKHLALKEKEIDEQKEYFIARLKGKENRHAEKIAIEKEKCKLLKKLLRNEASDFE